MGEESMSVRDDLLIVDDLMLLLMDDDGVSIQTAGTLHYALGGAVLTELALLGRIQTDDSGALNGPRVTPTGEGPLPDPLLQSAYDTIAEKTQRVQQLLGALGADLWQVVLDRLVDRGLLHREEAQLRVRIRRVLEDGEAPDPRTAAIIGLLFASGAVPSLRPPLPWTSTTVARASEIGRGHWGSETVATAVTRTAAAIVAASAARQRGDYHQVSVDRRQERSMTALDQAFDVDRPRFYRPRRRRRWSWLASGVVLVLVVTVGLGAAVFQFGLPWWMEEGDRNHKYASDTGTQRYQARLAPQYDGATRLPVIVAIPGCGVSGYEETP